MCLGVLSTYIHMLVGRFDISSTFVGYDTLYAYLT